MNAFTIPAKSSIVLRQKSAKQAKQDAKRVNKQEPSCTPNDFHKTARILKGGI